MKKAAHWGPFTPGVRGRVSLFSSPRTTAIWREVWRRWWLEVRWIAGWQSSRRSGWRSACRWATACSIRTGIAWRAFHGIFQVFLSDRKFMIPCGEQRCLINDVSQVGTGETRGCLRDSVEVNVRRERFAAGMQAKDGVAPVEIRRINHNLTVGAQERAIQHFGPVRGAQNNHAQVGLEPVHSHQQLIQGLLPLVVRQPHAYTALSPYRV